MTRVTIAEAMELADAKLAAGDFAETEGICASILQAFPDHKLALRLWARALAGQGRLDEALAGYECRLDALQLRVAPHDMTYPLFLLKQAGFSPRAILDIGAYVGEWTRKMGRLFPEARFLMLEAQPDKDEALRAVVAERPQQADWRIALLGRETCDAVPFYQVRGAGLSTGSSLFPENTAFPRAVLSLPMTTLDTLAGAHPWAPFDLIKLDVQGAELEILAGGAQSLEAAAVVICEMSLVPYNDGAPLIGEVLVAMEKAGFVLYDLCGMTRDRPGRLMQVDGVFLRHDSPWRPLRPEF